MMAATSCFFCGRTVDQVTHLVQGPDLFICDICVDACVDTLATIIVPICEFDRTNARMQLALTLIFEVFSNGRALLCRCTVASHFSGLDISSGRPASCNRQPRQPAHRVPSKPNGSGVRPGIDRRAGCAGCAMPECGRHDWETGSVPLPP
jgi:hypothetical protein